MKFFNRENKKGIIIFSVIFFLVGCFISLFNKDFSEGKDPVYGVTFSQKYAVGLNLNWPQTYLAILDDLRVNNLRLIAYWDEIEKQQDNFDFSDLDWQIQQAQERGAGIILALGRRTPRWPECHDPSWLKNLAPLAIQQQQLEFIGAVINRYRDNLAIRSWQIENEPLFTLFGVCPRPSKDFLSQEIKVAKSLDSRPIVITDSGELNHWQGAASLADVLGTTMYRIVWNRYSGFWDYFFVPAAFYHYKADLTKFFHHNLKGVIVTELQMEPWTMGQQMVELSLIDQQKSFDLPRFKNNIKYVKKTGFSEVYLWGVEYWYWLKEQGQVQIWDEAKKLWR